MDKYFVNNTLMLLHHPFYIYSGVYKLKVHLQLKMNEKLKRFLLTTCTLR